MTLRAYLDFPWITLSREKYTIYRLDTGAALTVSTVTSQHQTKPGLSLNHFWLLPTMDFTTQRHPMQFQKFLI